MTEKQPKAGWPNFKCPPDIYKQIRQLALDENKKVIDMATELLTTIRHVVKK